MPPLAPRRGLQPSRHDAVTLPEVVETEWPAGLPGTQGIASAVLEQVFDAAARVQGLKGIVVVRHGVLVGERYFHGASPSDLLPVNSITKSVTSMLVGLALQRGRLHSLDEPVRHLLPHAVASVPGSVLAGVSLRQILQGRTGAAFEIARAAEMLGAAEPLRFALRACRVAPPSRSGWTYNDAAISLLSPILQVAEGASLASLASRALFAPLGIRRFAWRRDLRDRPLAHAGLALRPRDLAKLAWLVLQHGRWQDRERLPADWVAESTRSHGPVEWRAPPMQDLGYGHLWFTGRLQARPLVWAQGYGGQFALIAPAQRLVVATAATSPAPQKAAVQMQAVRALVARIVLAAA